MDDLDLILCNRLQKQRDENKFVYLYESYEKISNHIVAKRKNMSQQVNDMQNITARFFVTCLVCPDTFEIIDDIIEVHDISSSQNANPFAGGDIEEMMAQAMMGGVMPGMGMNLESLASGFKFKFTKMQNDLWEAVKKTQFIFDRSFMKSI